MPACAGWTALDFLIPHGGSQARLTPAGGWRLHRFASVPRLVEPGCSGSRLAGKAGQSDTGGGFVAALRPVRIRGQASNRSIDSHQIAWSRPGGRRLPGSMQHKPRLCPGPWQRFAKLIFVGSNLPLRHDIYGIH